MNELKKEIELLEIKIVIYSERDWGMTKKYLDMLREKELQLLDLMSNN